MSFNSQSSESGSFKRERKGCLLMYASISTALLSLQFSFDLPFFSFCLSEFSFPSILPFLSLPFFLPPLFTVHGYLFLYHLPLWDLPLLSLNRFWLLMGISLGLPTILLAVQPLPLPRVCWLHHSPFLDKVSCLVSYLFLFLFYPYG